MLVGGGSSHYRWWCVGFKGCTQQLSFNPQRHGCWKSGCILLYTEAGGKTEVTFQRTYNYSQRKAQKRRLSCLKQQHHLRRSFEACWSSNQNWINVSKILLSLWELSSETQPVQISLQVKSRLMTLSMDKFKFQSN